MAYILIVVPTKKQYFGREVFATQPSIKKKRRKSTPTPCINSFMGTHLKHFARANRINNAKRLSKTSQILGWGHWIVCIIVRTFKQSYISFLFLLILILESCGSASLTATSPVMFLLESAYEKLDFLVIEWSSKNFIHQNLYLYQYQTWVLSILITFRT